MALTVLSLPNYLPRQQEGTIQISVKAQQIMMSACDTALRGNPGNAFLHFLPNLVFERRPPHARHAFLFFIHHMLVFINKIENRSFFLCFHYLTSNRAAIIHFCLIVICCLVHHDIDDMPPFGGYGGCGFALANPSIAPCVHSTGRNLSY
jgi:hypothetical protein